MSVKLDGDNQVSLVVSRLAASKGGEGAVKVDGTWGSFAPMLAAHVSCKLKRPIFYVSSHIDDADLVNDDLCLFGGGQAETFAVWEGEGDSSDATDEIGAQRLRVTLGLWQMQNDSVKASEASGLMISTCVQALIQPVPNPQVVAEGGLGLGVSQTIEPGLVTEWLVDNDFERVDSVDVPGQFAQRGGIIDIYAPVTMASAGALSGKELREAEPVRVEFFGDSIESIRKIDLDTQRSSEQVDEVCIVGVSGAPRGSQTEQLVNLLPSDTIIILEEPVNIAEVAEVFLSRVDDPRGLYSWKAIYKAMSKFSLLEISRFAGAGTGEHISLNVSSAGEYEHKAGATWKSNKAVLEELVSEKNERDVLLYCENAAEIKRVTEMISETHGEVPGKVKLVPGFIRQGFILDSLKTIVISHHEIFGQYAVRRRIRTIRTASPVERLLDLQKGDYVVHMSYGIGKFRGIGTMEKNEAVSEYLTIEYAGKSLIHVPVHNVCLVHKYIGSMERRPKLSKIGSKKWERQKERAAKGIEELAAQLLEVQAKRQGLGGFGYSADTTWQKEFEESFLYQETPDQMTAVERIKSDRVSNSPMDRLLGGDVV